jgi:uncharacterized membrane protein HdeD (DUF308 family)
MNGINEVLLGAAAMGSAVAALFFFRFWRQTKDRLFLMFAIAFVVDAFMRIILAIAVLPDETEPFFYLGRLLSFSLIVLAIIDKNRGGTSGNR